MSEEQRDDRADTSTRGGAVRWLDRAPDWRGFTSHRLVIQVGIDALCWIAAVLFAMLMRHEFVPKLVDWRAVVGWLALPVVTQFVLGALQGLYVGRYRFGSFEEMAGLFRVVLGTSVVFWAASVTAGDAAVPVSAVLGSGFIALFLTASVRYVWRLTLDRQRRPGDDAEPVIVFGAGEGGIQVVSSMLRDPNSPYRPVALLDDSEVKRNLTISGIAVEGTRAALASTADRYSARALVCAIPSASARLVAELSDLAAESDLRLLVVPPVRALPHGSLDVEDVRPLAPADLLGRREIDTDVGSIADYLAGRRVLVTGAGGSIGSELCRQIYLFAPDELIMVDRDESALHEVQLSLEGRALLDTPDLVVADIRDRDVIDDLFECRRPQVVFHAAALKHLTLLERYPREALRTNVQGTAHVLHAAARVGAETVVNISTDKAADPTSVLGYTKALAERLTARIAGDAAGTFLSVRFGNVLGSRGSVLTAFTAQLDNGGPITVTDPEVSRFFMTIEEAVQLVIQAGAVGRDGEALVLDMGDPVRIADLAQRLVAQVDRPIEIVYTGLRPGEKLHEDLVGADEIVRPGPHHLIRHVEVDRLGSHELSFDGLDGPELVEALSLHLQA